MVAWFSGLNPNILSALIAALAAILGVILKDLVVGLWKEQRRERKNTLDIYRSYADPLASAASALFWRLRETLIEEGRGAFLKTSGKSTQFDQYKYESTLYRLAVLIGWLRAYRRELTIFSLNNPAKPNSLASSIQKFEEALSEGFHVEMQRVRSLADLWRLPLPDDERKVTALGVALEQILKQALETKNVYVANDLNSKDRLKLSLSVANEMASQLIPKHLDRDSF